MDKSQLPKMLKKLHLYLLLLCSLIGFEGYAQTYPISITTQLTQPSPIYLSNYANAATINSPIKIQLILNDLTISNRQVKLKIYFQGNGISFNTNDFVVGARPLYLEGGFPLQLTNVDLAPYFEYQNLLGLNPNQYAQPLPEGIYNIYVEVYDFATGKKLSSKTRTNTIIFQNEPPFLNLPLNNASIMQQNIQNIIFSWTPRSINVSNVEYEFSLVEIWDKYTPIQNAFAYSPPLYTTTTRTTTLQYSINEPQLIPGKKYAWRIKAKAILGAEEIGVFKNNGYSEIFSFDYEISCTPPLGITTSEVSENQAKIAWSGNIDNYDYQVNYREKNANSEWYKQVTPRENITLSNLKPNTAYEYTVGSSCDPGKYTHSTIKEFTTVARDEIAFEGCGIKPDPNDLSNTTPLPNLYQNDVVTAGDFPIVVIKATGSNGTFTGEGYVTLPFIEKFRKLIDATDNLKDIANKGAEIVGKVGTAANASANLASNTATKVSNRLDSPTGDSIENSAGKIKDKVADVGTKVNEKAGEIAGDVGKYSTNIGEHTRIRITFNNIGVNTDFKLISGEIIASYDPTWKNIANLDGIFNDAFGSNGKPIEGKFDYEVVSVVLNADGSTTVTGKEGQTSTIVKSPYERVYVDSTGKVVTIPANGAGAPTIANAAAGGKATAANTNGMSASGDVIKITSPDVKITFENADKSKYAFDVLPGSGSQKLKDTYETIPMENGAVYNVNYKAVSDLNGPETFIAKAEFKNGKTTKDVVFKTNAGAKVNFKWNNDTEAVITVEKTLNFSKESIIATVNGETKKDPADPAKTIEAKADIAGKINLWQLAQKPVINITILSINGASAPSADKAKEFLSEVYNKVGIKFDVTSQDLTIGPLPTAIQCGDSGLINFYSDGQIDIKNQIEANPNFTYNSETYYVIYTGKPGQDGYKGFMPLGGQYAFVFDNTLKTVAHELGHGIFGLKHPFSTNAESGKTDLLMDYGDGTVLSHNDWDIIHSGGWKFYGFQKSSSGAQLTDNNNFLMPNHKPFRFKDVDAKSINANIVGQDALIIPTNSNINKYPGSNGALFSFKSNGKTYTFHSDEGAYIQEESGISYTNAYSDANAGKPFLLLVRHDCFYYFVTKKLSKDEYETPDLDTSNYTFIGNSCPSDSEILCQERLKVIANYMSTSKSGVPITYESLALTNQEQITPNKDGNSIYDIKYRKFIGEDNSQVEINSFFRVDPSYNAKPYYVKTNNKTLIDHGIEGFWIYMGSNDVTASGNLKVEIRLEQFDHTDPNNTKPSPENYCSLENTTLRRGQYVGDIGNFYLAVIMAPIVGVAVVEAMPVVSMEILTKKALEYYTKKAIIDCIVGASVDLALQYGIGEILKEEGEDSEGLSTANAALACATNALISNKNIVLGSAIYGFGDNIIKQLKSGKSINQIDISESEKAALRNAIIALSFKTISTIAVNQKWGTALTQKIIKVLDRVAIKSNYINSSIRPFIAKTAAGTALFFATHQMPIIREADNFVVKIEQIIAKEATSETIEIIGNNAQAITKTIQNEAETLIQENSSAIFTGKVGITKIGEMNIFSYLKGDNLLSYLQIKDQIYKLVNKFNPNEGLTLASVLASVKNPNTTKCTACIKQDEATCKKFEQLQAKVGTHGGIAKLCAALAATNANQVITKLLTWDKAQIILFLNDVNEASSKVEHISQNIPKIDISILNSWEIVINARCTNISNCSSLMQKDWKVLQEVKAILENNQINNDLGSSSGLTNYIKTNTRSKCSICGNTGVDFIQPMDLYLKDLAYFASQYTNATGRNNVKNLLVSSADRTREAEYYILKVIKANPNVFNNITAYEYTDLTGCEPDVVNGGVYCEFKSWSNIPKNTVDKDDPEAASSSNGAFSYFKTSPTGNSFKQFKALLSTIQVNNMNKIAYYFDALKLAGTDNTTKATWIKDVFKEMMYKNNIITQQGNEVFNAIWSNTDLRTELFPDHFTEANKAEALTDFNSYISNTNNSFYNFIKVL